MDFQTGGELILPSGVTLTINSSINAPVHQRIFAGAGAVAGIPQDVPAEWFGAIGDGIADNRAALQAALNAVGPQRHVHLQYANYNISGAITIPAQVGLVGPEFGYIQGTYAQVRSTSASGSVIDLAPGKSGSNVQNFAIGRTVLPAPGSRGISCVHASVYLLKNLAVSDSYSDLYYNGCPSGYQGTYNVSAIWGENGVSGYPPGAALYGFELDSENGTAENSIIFQQVGAGNAPRGSNMIGLYVHGTAINDVNVTGVNSTGGEGLKVLYDGNGREDSAYDLHFNQVTLDACTARCVEVSGIPPNGSVEFDDLYAIGSNGNTAAVSIMESSNVRINGSMIGNTLPGGGLLVSGGSSNMVTNGQWGIVDGGNAITLSNTTKNVISNQTIYGQQATSMSAMIYVQNGSHSNLFSQIVGTGYANYGLAFDGTSDGNVVDPTVNFYTPTVAHPFTDTASTTTGLHSNGGCRLPGVPAISLGPGAGIHPKFPDHARVSGGYLEPGVLENNCNFTLAFYAGATPVAGATLFQASFTDPTGAAIAFPEAPGCTLTQTLGPPVSIQSVAESTRVNVQLNARAMAQMQTLTAGSLYVFNVRCGLE